MDDFFGIISHVMNYIWNILDLAWKSFAHTMQTDVAVVMMSPGLTSIVSILVVGYAYLLGRE
jgi:hypothetical protein